MALSVAEIAAGLAEMLRGEVEGRQHAEVLAARLGLGPAGTAYALADADRRVAILAAAHAELSRRAA